MLKNNISLEKIRMLTSSLKSLVPWRVNQLLHTMFGEYCYVCGKSTIQKKDECTLG